MPFREKKAWVTIFALLIVFLPYYYFMKLAYHVPEPNYIQLGHLATVALVIFAVLEIVLILIARQLSPHDAGMPLDELEKLYAFRASRVAYVTLISLVLVVSFLMIHTYGGNWGWGMMYLAAIIGSEIARAIAIIVQYRRGY